MESSKSKSVELCGEEEWLGNCSVEVRSGVFRVKSSGDPGSDRIRCGLCCYWTLVGMLDLGKSRSCERFGQIQSTIAAGWVMSVRDLLAVYAMECELAVVRPSLCEARVGEYQ